MRGGMGNHHLSSCVLSAGVGASLQNMPVHVPGLHMYSHFRQTTESEGESALYRILLE